MDASSFVSRNSAWPAFCCPPLLFSQASFHHSRSGCTLIPRQCAKPRPSPPSLACSSTLTAPVALSRLLKLARGPRYQKRIPPITARGGGRYADHCLPRFAMAFALSCHGHSSPPQKWPIARMQPIYHYEKPVLQTSLSLQFVENIRAQRSRRALTCCCARSPA